MSSRESGMMQHLVASAPVIEVTLEMLESIVAFRDGRYYTLKDFITTHCPEQAVALGLELTPDLPVPRVSDLTDAEMAEVTVVNLQRGPQDQKLAVV
jgi:hypothetical protein